MKTKFLLLMLTLAVVRLTSQNYYLINFAGNPETVFAENLMQGKSVNLSGADTLRLVKGTGVKDIGITANKLTVFPNPMDQTCYFEFENIKKGRVSINIYSIDGRTAHKYSQKLQQGIHLFGLSGVPAGAYIISVKTEIAFIIGRFVSTGQSDAGFMLTHKNESPLKSNNGQIIDDTEKGYENIPLEYRSIIDLDYAVGNQLKFIGKKTGYENDTVYASPTANQTITFEFCAKPFQPSPISGNNNPCQGATGITYNVTNVTGVTYTWKVPAAWTITTGQGTHSITVTVGNTSGNITVTPSNSCGTGPANSLDVTTQSIPAQPSTISGNILPCQGATETFSVTNVSNVNYTWSIPAGWAITSGQNTNAITVSVGSSSGNITVTPSNACGSGTAQSLSVTPQAVPIQAEASDHISSQVQIIWNWNYVANASGYKYNIVNDYATATDNGTSTTYTQTGLTCNTPYNLYVWAYNTCGNSAVLILNDTTAACINNCGTVSFNYNGNQVTYGTVISANNRCWLDRNLGATQVAISPTDTNAYGHLFQWGRLADGHQLRTSDTTSVLSTTDVPGHNKFIVVNKQPYDWRSPQNYNLWHGVNGINNPCPSGYRIPTEIEWETEIESWNNYNSTGAFISPLKLTMAGIRYNFDGTIHEINSWGKYWKDSDGVDYPDYVVFDSLYAGISEPTYRSNGLSVRCIKDCPVPVQPALINGNNNPCQGSSETYSVSNIADVIYTWKVPNGWIITSGQNTHNINVTVGSASGNITVTPSNSCGQGISQTLAVSSKTIPAQPSAINGESLPCQGSSKTYSVSNVANVSYTWSVPTGWIITSGQNTSSIKVTVANSAGTISVTPSNVCGNGTARTLAITPQTIPSEPSQIYGNESVCSGIDEIYAVANVPNVTYIWTVPAGWTIQSGTGTSEILVTPGATSGEIIVTPSNDCGNGTESVLTVTSQSIPAQPSVITGNSEPCYGTSQTYSVSNVAGVTYNWSVPYGWIITSGQGTNSITATIGSEGGYLTVTPNNDCGDGMPRSRVIDVLHKPYVDVEISGNQNPCQGSTEIYSTYEQPDVTFTWTVPAGWTINSGQGTSNISVIVGTSSGPISVVLSNICGNGSSDILNITVQALPAQPSVINGEENPCQGYTEIYSVTNVAGVSYTWTVPAGWSITAGQGTNNITVSVGTAAGTITVTPSIGSCEGPERSLAVTTQTVPAQPSAITGNNNPCQGATGLNYTVTNVTGVTYTWSVPPDWTITAGQGTNSITITVGSASGNITVVPSNVCGDGTQRSLAVTTHTVPSQPSSITGNNNPCQGTTQTYSITNVSGVTYTWSVPSGWTITNGQGTYSITVTAGTAAGNITVTPSNDCGNGTAQVLAVTTQTIPAQPSAISGNNNPCQGVSGLIYSVTNLSGVTYTWSVPSGWTITNGQGTSSITATASTSSGNVSVTPSNTCGNGTASTLAVTVQLIPAQPSAITGNNNPCQGATGLTYSVTNVSGVTYTWTVPSGWNITAGQGTNSITVTAGSSSGNITVTPSNTCGTGTARTLVVTTQTVPAQPSAISGSNNPCQGLNGIIYSVTNVSGVSYTWSVPSGWSINSGQGTSSIMVTAGSTSGNISVTPSNTCGNGPSQSMSVTTHTFPASPTAGTHVPSQTQIVWNWNSSAGATGYKYNTTNNYATATDNGTSTTWTQTGLTCNTAYTLYVWAYNGCGNSTAVQLSQTTSACPPNCGSVTFTYNGSTVTYGTVISANNRCWLDRNLGATQVATSSTDAASYGHLFQWGRLDDGHQVRTSPTTTTLSNSDVPGHGNFILALNYPNDWRSPQNENLWQGVDGINNPCPDGYRLPTQTEWDTERFSWGSNDANGAYNSPLKIPLAGYRSYLYGGSIFVAGSQGFYWSSTANGIGSMDLIITNSDIVWYGDRRAFGFSIRCLKD